MYKGAQIDFLVNTERAMKRNGKVLFHTETMVQYAPLHRTRGMVTEHSGDMGFAFGWSRQWKEIAPRLTLAVGGETETNIGGTYNRMNGNNPANARLSLNLACRAEARYSAPVKRKSLDLRYTASLPLLGGMFAPQYGQSYYNLFSQGRYDHNLVLAHPGNQRNLRQRLTVGLPTRHRLTIGYLCDIRQTRVHHLTARQVSHLFLIGLAL